MTLRPVSTGERIEVLDALRGAALFGIIAANMRGFSGPLAAYFDHTLMWTDPVSRGAQALVDIFIQGKFITLFAFMFGIGFAIQMAREQDALAFEVYLQELLRRRPDGGEDLLLQLRVAVLHRVRAQLQTQHGTRRRDGHGYECGLGGRSESAQCGGAAYPGRTSRRGRRTQ